MGWQRTTTYVKGKGAKAKQVIEHSSFELRAWELAGLAAAGAIFYWVFMDAKKSGTTTDSGFSSNPWAWYLGGPVGAWVWGGITGLQSGYQFNRNPIGTVGSVTGH